MLEDLIYRLIYHVPFYFYKWYFYIILPNTHIFIYFSSRSRNIHPFKTFRSLSIKGSGIQPRISPSPSLLSPSLPTRSVYGFDFTLRFILSIPLRSTPSFFLFTQIHLITSAAVANQRIRECAKKINMAHPGAGDVLEQCLA